MDFTPEPGMIGFSNNKSGGWLIRFFTRSQITHNFVFTHPVNGIPSVEEASAKVQIVPFESHYFRNSNYAYQIYRVIAPFVTKDDIDNALVQIFEEFAGVKYGWLQLLYFPYRWFKETVLRQKDVHREKNWFTKGMICSELQFWFLKYLDPEFSEMLADYDGDTVQPNDMLQIVKSRPEYFELVSTQD
ncbi:MAG: hypothetical protein OEM41_08530 [Ignavibacteria bacterium]|nr:hypothetical protein [Ignavibacteria bacterium]